MNLFDHYDQSPKWTKKVQLDGIGYSLLENEDPSILLQMKYKNGFDSSETINQ